MERIFLTRTFRNDSRFEALPNKGVPAKNGQGLNRSGIQIGFPCKSEKACELRKRGKNYRFSRMAGFFLSRYSCMPGMTVGELLRLNTGENIWRWVWLAVAILIVMCAIVLARNRTPHKHPSAALSESETNSSFHLGVYQHALDD